ncbi:PIN domain-containing protein [Candidatus Woesearchaeota archaeon]|nr:PIN domain-containing protein [Candidatus Woesearchaeota archaeon]
MMRVLLDTNVYAKLVLDEEVQMELLGRIPSQIMVYGSEVNRHELRDLPKGLQLYDRNERILLLRVYDLLTQKEKRTYRTTPFVEMLALKYFEEYVRLKGNKGYEELRKDFVIVATASLHNLDIIVSEDKKTMFSAEARKAYEAVNQNNQIRTPQMIGYAEFKQMLRRIAP